MKVVVDTNVAIAANGRDTHASLTCQFKCTEFLQELVSPIKRTQIILDMQGMIFDEYSRHLNYKGEPGVGDIFFKYLHDHMYLGKKVRLIAITPIDDETRGFNELPTNTVDKSDQKFLATAIVSNAAIINAVDTDWHEQGVFITNLGVNVRQLCPEHACTIA
jgi:predicted nucleic acid-binding protein